MTLHDYPAYPQKASATRVEVDGVELNVFRVIRGPLAQVTPGWTQINVGSDVPAKAITLPTHWWDYGNGTIVVSGTRVRKLK